MLSGSLYGPLIARLWAVERPSLLGQFFLAFSQLLQLLQGFIDCVLTGPELFICNGIRFKKTLGESN